MPPFKPYVSARQRRWAHTATGKDALGAEDVAGKDRASKGRALPERAGASAREHGRRLAAAKMSRQKSAPGPARSFAAHRAAMGVLLALFLMATPARSATYYVNAALGNDANNGTSASTPWATIGKANATVVANDVVLISPGTYFDMPNPAPAAEASGPIYFYGDISHSEWVNLHSTTQINRSHVSIRGVTFTYGVSGALGALRDSILDFKSLGGIYWHGHYSYIGRGTALGSDFWLGRDSANAVGNVFDELTMTNIGRGKLSGLSDILFGGNGGRADSNTVQFCNFTGYTEPLMGANGPSFRQCFLTTNQVWKYNHYAIDEEGTTGPFVLYERDSSQNNKYEGDTLTTFGNGSSMIEMPAGGHYTNSCKNVVIDSSYIRLNSTNYDWFGAADRLNNFKMTFTTVVVRGSPALQIQDAREGLLLKNDTFAGDAGNTAYSYGGVVLIGGETSLAWQINGAGSDSVKILNDIFYALSPAPGLNKTIYPYGTCRYVDGVNATGGPSCFSFALRPDWFKLDSVAFNGGGISRKPRENWNLYAMYSDSTTPGDRAIVITQNGGIKYSSSGGNVAVAVPNNAGTGWWFAKAKLDSASVYGSPLFADSGLATFDAHLTTGSAAIGKAGTGTFYGANATDIGAVANTAVPVCIVAPASLTFVQTFAGIKNIVITNAGGASLTITSLTSNNSNVTVGSVPGSLTANNAASVSITYSGVGAGATLTLVTTDPKNPTILIPVIASNQNNGTDFGP